MEKGKYKAILFAPDGDYTTYFRDRDTIEDVWKEIENMGSRWVFYPICCVGTDKTIVDVPYGGFEYLKGKRIKTVKKIIAEHCDELCEALNAGNPVYHILPQII